MDVDAALKLVQSHYNLEPRLAINQAAMALSDALMARAAREPLVLEVVACVRLADSAPTYGHQLKAQEAAWEACRKLAEWKL